MKRLLLHLLIVFATASVARSQNIIAGDAQYIAEITALSDELDAGIVAENLSLLSERPVLINSADEEETGRLFFLTQFQIRVLSDHVRNHGNIVSIYEVASLPGFDRETATYMAPYISFEIEAKKNTARLRSGSLVTTFCYKPGYDNGRGLRTLLKAKYGSAVLSYGITAENDPGESFSFTKRSGADFLSGFIMYTGSRFINRVIAGDYSLRFGEGLVLNNNSWLGSGLISPSFNTGKAILSPYTSTDENRFFRGVALSAGSVNKGVVLFISSNAIDARKEYLAGEDTYVITNLVQGGIHVSESDLLARDAVTERLAGAHVTLGSESWRGGLTCSLTHFSLPFAPDSTDRFSRYNFSGRELINAGLDFKAGTGKIFFFSEIAMSVPGSWALIAGIRAIPSARVSFSLLTRNYSFRYFSFHSGSFRAGSVASNETGLSGNIHVEVARHLFISAGADLYYNPWLRYRSSSPSAGRRFDIRGDYSPGDALSLRVEWSLTVREYDMNCNTGIAESERFKRDQLTAVFVFRPAEETRLTTRGGYAHISPSGEEGYMLCQDVSLPLFSRHIKLWLRYALFSTGGYDSRLYAWENDLLHTYSIPVMSGEGVRTSIMVSWHPSPVTELRAKYGVTMVREEETHKMNREVKLQCRIVF